MLCSVQPTKRDLAFSPSTLGLVLAVVMIVLALATGLRAAGSTQDVDEAAFRQTLSEMQHGSDYYRALRDALVEKEHKAPPSNVRAYRPPTLYLLLARLPESMWRWAAVVPFTVMILGAWAIGEHLHRLGAPAAVVLVGVWAISSAPHAYLYTELWGAAALIAGLAMVQRDRVAAAACCFAAAVLLRELFLVAFVVAALHHWRDKTWRAATVVVAALGAVHVYLANQVLDPNGFQPALRAIDARLGVVDLVSPGNAPIAVAVGLIGIVGGGIGLLRGVIGRLPASRIAAAHAIILCAGTLAISRSYWALTFAPATAAFTGGCFGSIRRMTRPRLTDAVGSTDGER
ncbi:MAG: hypothetical protein QOJ67_458 [Acidimicrobiaceae bacterium]|jgi:hypothetical protein